MEKPIEIILLKDAEDYTDSLEISAKKKLFFAIRKTKERIFGDWFKKLQGTDGIFEFRIMDSNKWYRLFAFWDKIEKIDTIVISTHGLIKKTNKTPSSDIIKAERLRDFYFKQKNRKDEK